MQISPYPGGHFGHGAAGMTLNAVRLRGTDELRFPPPAFLHGDPAVETVPLGPLGRLYTWTTVHPGKAPAYSLAMVDFAPGVRVFGRLLVGGDTAPVPGDALRVVPWTLPDGTPDYAFEPVAGGTP